MARARRCSICGGKVDSDGLEIPEIGFVCRRCGSMTEDDHLRAVRRRQSIDRGLQAKIDKANAEIDRLNQQEAQGGES